MKNKRTNLSLLLSTCDSYMPLWEGFFKSFSNHFKDDIDLFMTGTGTYDLGSNIVRGIGHRYKFSDFSTRIIAALRKIKSDYVLFMLDDFYLLSDVDTIIFNNTVKILESDKNVGLIILHDELSHKCYMKDEYNDYYVELKKTAPYCITTQAALWRKSFLKKVLRKGESPWQFEYLASYRARRYKESILYRKDELYYFFNYPYGGVMGDGRVRKEFLHLVSNNEKVAGFTHTYVRRTRPTLPLVKNIVNLQIAFYPFLSVFFRFVKKKYDYIPKKVCSENDTSDAIYYKK